MASDEPQLSHKVLDLLYDDELSETEREAAREQIEASEHARAELDSFESMLERIREVDVDEDVPESVHASIMDAAREHAGKSATRQARLTGRAPSAAPSSEHKSLWSKLQSSGVSQLVLAATVVLVAGIVFVQLGTQKDEVKFMQAEEAVNSKITFGGEEGDKLAKYEPPPAPAESEPAGPQQEVAEGAADKLGAETADEARAQAQAPATSGEAQSGEDQSGEDQRGEAEKSKIGELAQLDKTARPVKPATRKAHRSRRRAPQRSEVKVARKAKSRKKSTDTMFDVLRGSSRSTNERAESESKPRPAPAPAAKQAAPAEEYAAADREDTAQNQPQGAGSASKSGLSDSVDLGQFAAGNIAETDDSSTGAAAAEPTPSKDSTADEDATSGVSTMESSYASGNYAGVVTQADRYLSRSSAGGADEARVLELKARALAKQGKTSEADQTYAELQRKHPSYKSDQVRRERQDLAKKREQKARRRRSAPAKKLDLEAAPQQQEAQQPVQSAPIQTGGE